MHYQLSVSAGAAKAYSKTGLKNIPVSDKVIIMLIDPSKSACGTQFLPYGSLYFEHNESSPVDCGKPVHYKMIYEHHIHDTPHFNQSNKTRAVVMEESSPDCEPRTKPTSLGKATDVENPQNRIII
ncbi:hypothetical protein J6590_029843 [Homalodisca vitripennis]|nr:hypothetical protein J6590_029843 [Homalodisca vitripennis]